MERPDIVDRLRSNAYRRDNLDADNVALLDAAADEIERLRAACQAVVDTCHGAGAKHWASCEQARRALEPKP